MSTKSGITDFVKRELSKSSLGAHTFDHTMRVYSLAIQLSKGLPVNMRVIEAAALLHDVGRPREREDNVSHSILSGQMSKECLKGLKYTTEEIDQIIDAIRTHRFSEGIEPNSLEGQILSDADKLDAMGAIGIYRAVAQAAASGRGIQGFLSHADEKLLRLRDLMYTTPAKQLAAERHKILSSFVEELRRETRESIMN
jgi:uncharacterized protein